MKRYWILDSPSDRTCYKRQSFPVAMPVSIGRYGAANRSSATHISLGQTQRKASKAKCMNHYDANLSSAKRESQLKKCILWRGNMVQVLLGRKGVDAPYRSAVVRIQTNNARLVKIDCGGEKFITTEESLSRYPNTLLGNPLRRAEFYDPKTETYYFDRNQDLFNAILYFYQSPGTFRAPESFDPVVVEEELEFFGIDLKQMIDDYDEIEAANRPKRPPTLRETINKTITDPSYNPMGMLWGTVDLICIMLTIGMLVVETVPGPDKYFKKPFAKDENGDPEILKMILYGLDSGINIFFTFDVLVKFLSSPEKNRFLFNAMNIMDILAVSPYYVELYVFARTAGGEPPAQFFALKVLRVCRIMRVVRVLKLVRHSKQLTEVTEVVSSAKQEFIVLIGVVGVVILLVGTIMYFVEFQIPDEEEQNKEFASILLGCWWAIVTITTVGYGDIHPTTSLGMLTGSIVVLFGIVVLAFPMTIIISKFQDSFTVKKLKANKEMTRKLREMALTGCNPSHMTCGPGNRNNNMCAFPNNTRTQYIPPDSPLAQHYSGVPKTIPRNPSKKQLCSVFSSERTDPDIPL